MNDNWISPKNYFQHIVEPTVQEYWADGSDHHKENAISRLSSFSERYFKYHNKNGNSEKIYGAVTLSNFAQKIFNQCPESHLLWQSANGVKHHFPDARTRPDALVSSSTGTWTDEKYSVGGRYITIGEAIRTTHAFWQKRLETQ